MDAPIENETEQQRLTYEGGHIQVGAISDSRAIAIGQNATVIYQGLSLNEVVALIVELKRKDQPTVWDGRIPYLGLQAFQENDAEFFFGREKVVNDLLTRVKNHSFMVIAGPSGSGKSSVARAGLLHALQQGHFERSERWLFATMHPGDDPLEQLAQAVSRLARSPMAGDYIREKGGIDTDTLHKQIETLLKEDSRQRAVLLVDQFEEIFSPNQDTVARIAFINLLAAAVQNPHSRTKIILTLRSDFVPAFADYPQLNELINQQFYQVGTMERHDLGTAIILPALKVGAKIDPELVVHITADMKGEPGALPLMSFVLRDLFETTAKKKGDPLTLRLSDYLQRGGIEDALQRHADHAFAQFSATQQALARHIFSRLVEIGERVDTRRTVTLSELIPLGGKAEGVAAVIHTLANDKVRLLTIDRLKGNEADTPTQSTITIAHEKLIDAWPWLRQLVVEKREVISLQNQINSDARLWAREKDGGYLYRGGRLTQVEERLKELQLDKLSQQFIEASVAEWKRQEAAEEEKRRTVEELRIQQEVNRRIQISQLIFAMQSELSQDPERALLLAVACLGLNIQPDTHLALANGLQSRYRTTLYGHEDSVGSAVFSPDGQTILTASNDGTARLWDRQGNTLAILQGHKKLILSAVFSPDGQTILTASNDGTTRLWDRQGNILVVIRGHTGSVNSAVFSPNGQPILTASADNTARLWDSQGNQLAVLLHEDNVYSAVFSPDGQTILTASRNRTAWLWDQQGNVLAVLRGHAGSVNSAVFSPDGRTILTASGDRTAQLWDRQGNQLTVLRGHNDVWSVMFSPDGQTILTAGCDESDTSFKCINSTARLWDSQGNQLAVLLHEDEVFSAVFSPDGRTILTASGDGTARLWNRQGNALAVLRGHKRGFTSTVFSPDGQTILTISEDGTARLWSRQRYTLAALRGHERGSDSAAFSPDGQTILTISEDGRVRLWNRQGYTLAVLRGHGRGFASAMFSPDGRTILTVSWDNMVQLWDNQGNLLADLLHKDEVYSAIFSPDGRTILTVSWDNTARLWDSWGNQLAVLLHEDVVNSVMFSPDGRTILTVSWDGTARLWDSQGNGLVVLNEQAGLITSAVFSPDGQTILTDIDNNTARLWDSQGNQMADLLHKDEVYSAVFSPDGRTILTTSGDGMVRLWDSHGNQLTLMGEHEDKIKVALFNPDGQSILTVRDYDDTAWLWDRQGRELAVLRGHNDWINLAVFSPNGQTILTASNDRTMRLWDRQGNELTILRGHEDIISSVEFSSDGQTILTSSEDGTVQIWPTYTIEYMVQEAYWRIKRGFTEEECQQYFRDDPTACPRTKEELFAPLAAYLHGPKLQRED